MYIWLAVSLYINMPYCAAYHSDGYRWGELKPLPVSFNIGACNNLTMRHFFFVMEVELYSDFKSDTHTFYYLKHPQLHGQLK